MSNVPPVTFIEPDYIDDDLPIYDDGNDVDAITPDAADLVERDDVEPKDADAPEEQHPEVTP